MTAADAVAPAAPGAIPPGAFEPTPGAAPGAGVNESSAPSATGAAAVTRPASS